VRAVADADHPFRSTPFDLLAPYARPGTVDELSDRAATIRHRVADGSIALIPAERRNVLAVELEEDIFAHAEAAAQEQSFLAGLIGLATVIGGAAFKYAPDAGVGWVVLLLVGGAVLALVWALARAKRSEPILARANKAFDELQKHNASTAPRDEAVEADAVLGPEGYTMHVHASDDVARQFVRVIGKARTYKWLRAGTLHFGERTKVRVESSNPAPERPRDPVENVAASDDSEKRGQR
jgi:hypothetical protein